MAKAVKKIKSAKEPTPPPADMVRPFLTTLHGDLVKLIPGAGSVDERQILADRVAAFIETL